MKQRNHSRPVTVLGAILAVVAGIAVWILLASDGNPSEWTESTRAARRQPTGYPQLVSIERLPEVKGEMCAWLPASASAPLSAALLQREQLSARAATPSLDDLPAATTRLERAPVRVIRGPYPLFTGVTVDPVRNEIIATDENFLNIVVYDRLTNTPPHAAFTEPKRVIGGSREEPQDSEIQYPCGVYVDPENGDTYVVSNDISREVQVFPHGVQGNAPPARRFRIPMRTFGMAVDNENKEIFITVEQMAAVLVFNKWADEYDAPIRFLDGRDTGLADPHGITVDPKNNLIFVANQGARSEAVGEEGRHYSLKERFIQGDGDLGWLIAVNDELTDEKRIVVPGSGRYYPPSITVYSRTASGNTKPLRVIQGPKTQLNWPGHIFVDPERGELYVANTMGDSILVFHTTDSGDVAPYRILQGPKTVLSRPSGVFLDTKNDELVVSSMRNNAITVYRRDAAGNTAPIRIIRGGPLNEQAPMILKPSGVAFDTKREEILVPS